VSGVLTQGAEFVLTPISGGNSYDNLIRLLDAGENNVVGVYEAAVNGKYTGSLVITFTVGAKYDGRKLTVYHEKKDGTTEAFTQIVQDGKVSVTVNELSPFLLAVARETAPAGGDAAISSASGTDAGVRSASGAYEMYVGTAVLLALGLAAVLYAVIRRRKHE